MKRLLLLLLAGAGLWLAACSSQPSSSTSLADRLVAPGGTSTLLDQARIADAVARVPHRNGTVPGRDGVPIFWCVFDPGNYGLAYHYLPQRHESGKPLDTGLSLALPQPFLPQAPKGTVVLLHGWMMNGDSMLPWSLQLAQSGYRVAAIDLRNHGHSDHGPSGYGTFESDDVVDVIQALRTRGEVIGPLYLFGVSYGAATALFTADKLGDQVTGVVTMESFANAGAAIRTMIPHLMALQPDGLMAQAAASYARWRYGSQDINAVIAAAGQRLDLDLDAVDVTRALADTRACVLLMHGDNDQHIPVQQGRALALSNPRVHYIEMRGEDHITLPLRMDLLGGVVDDWLASDRAGSAHCPAPEMPAEANLMALSPNAATPAAPTAPARS
ncbi:MAG: 2-succinyl-6-hydroxy-2,4-cyclohexadiene-1-carboxylate synthase [Stenotrophomonas maltophilia]|uniref:2-succinyl-6-hydroxy-2, 4-cyclohexadiene-1-carboxylate synthase n=1 Tax=Stenotrophomonas maltophilia TaxID=40324 RepID=A0A7V8FI93_STEMA|nr:MAG: 2-succinyl-6-hydroxy-2,4-cyclohexadiene-1-carboxylate synthase [Stenotrophomonas maltophilia]